MQKPAVLILNNVYYDIGTSVQEAHNKIGAWYGIPHVSIRDTLYAGIRAGQYTEKELTQDGLHPNDKGHELAAAQITALLEKVKLYMWEDGPEYAFPKPMTANAYEAARRLTIREISP